MIAARTSPTGAIRALAAAAVCLSTGWLLAATPGTKLPLVWALLLLVPVGVLLLRIGASSRFDLFAPPTIVVGLLVAQFPVQALYTVLLDRYRSALLPVDRWSYLVDVSLALCALGMLAFAGGYLLPSAVRRRSSADAHMAREVAWDAARVRLLVLVFSSVGAYAYVRFMSEAGGLQFFLHNLQARVELAKGRHDLLAVSQLLPLGSLIWWAELARRRSRPGSREWLAFGGHVVVATLMLYTLGGRGNVVNFWLGLLVVYHYGVRRLRARVAVGFALTAVVFLALAGWYRASTAGTGEAPRFTPSQVVSPRKVADELLNYDVSSLDVFALALDKVPRDIPYRLGASVTDTVYQPVPRSLLPGKPLVLTAWYKRYLLGSSDWGGVRASALGEGYVDFGIPGIVLLLMVYGLLGRWSYDFVRSRAGSASSLVVYALLVQFFVQVSIGAFDESSINLLQRLVPFLLAARLLAGRTADRRAPATGRQGLAVPRVSEGS